VAARSFVDLLIFIALLPIVLTGGIEGYAAANFVYFLYCVSGLLFHLMVSLWIFEILNFLIFLLTRIPDSWLLPKDALQGGTTTSSSSCCSSSSASTQTAAAPFLSSSSAPPAAPISLFVQSDSATTASVLASNTAPASPVPLVSSALRPFSLSSSSSSCALRFHSFLIYMRGSSASSAPLFWYRIRAVLIILLGIALFIAAITEAFASPRVVTVDVSLTHCSFPPALDGFRLVMASDIHIGSPCFLYPCL
jgi:hypothetical protein